jgi:hypothetical protein
MTLSSIVVYAAIQFFLIFQAYYVNKTNQMEKITSVMQFYSSFKSEFINSTEIELKETSIYFTTSNMNHIVYELDSEYITRTVNLQTDTFHLKVSNFSLIPFKDTHTIMAISMEVNCNNNVYPIYLCKPNSFERMVMQENKIKSDLYGN